MKKNIFVFLILVLSIFIVSKNVSAADIKIERGCSSGLFWTYTDCETGKAISHPSAMSVGKNRFALNPDGKGFKVLISGGQGTYKVTANISGGQEFYVADYAGNTNILTLTADAIKQGWTSSGVEIFAPKDIPVSNAWADYIYGGNTFYVIFDTTSFDDSGWIGASDPMGTLKGGETYTVQYNSSSTNWSVTGLNEGSGAVITFGYKTINPKDNKLNLWGRVYSFTADGVVIDGTYGPVGHLSKTEKPVTKFPIAELGSCKSEADCQSFCTKQENMMACISYGEKTGLVTKEQADQSRKFSDVLKGEGPGSCKDKASCEAFCSDLKNIDSCLTFAEKHDLIPAGALKEAKQVASALKAGATMPGGCKDKDSCSSYCAVSANATECLGFAEKAGFVSAEDAALARKVLPLINSGQSPGGCKTKDECQKYCNNDSNTTECLTFAEKAGLISPEDAAMAKKVGGKGPGGCKSKDTCAAFCNDTANQESCFQFAKEHDIIPADKLKQMQDGVNMLKAGLKQSPPEVLQCLKDNFGQGVIGDIEGGKFMPGPEMGAKIKDCFEKNMGKLLDQMKSSLDQATPETIDCLNKELGAGGLDKIKAGATPTSEQGAIFQKCFEAMKTQGMDKFKTGLGQMPPEARACLEDKLGKDKVAAYEKGDNTGAGAEVGKAMQDCAAVLKSSALKMMDDKLNQAPAEIRDCVKSKINDEMMAKIQSGQAGQEVVTSLVTACMANFKPKIPDSFKPENIPQGFSPSDIPTGMPSGFTIPTGDYGPSSGSIPGGMSTGFTPPTGTGTTPPAGMTTPPTGTTAPTVDCSVFAPVPSCSYVPEAVRAQCQKCKGQ